MERPSRVLHHGNPKIWFFQKSLNFDFWQSWNHLSFVKISNWYINGKVYTSTSPWKPKNMIFFPKKLEIDKIEFCPYPEFPYAEKRNRHGFVNISPILVIDTSMEWSSSTTTWEPKIWLFFKKIWNWIWLVLKSWNQHSSRSHLYVDIGDASSSLWGSTSSLNKTLV